MTTGLLAQQPFSLEEAVQYGLDHSNDLRLAQLDIGQANADIKEVKSIGMPRIEGSIGYQYYFQLPAQPVPDFVTPGVYGVLFEEGLLEERDLGPPEVFEAAFVQPHQFSPGVTASGLLFSGEYINCGPDEFYSKGEVSR